MANKTYTGEKFMNIYVMRHGTTCWNEKGIIQGRSNNRLSQAGKLGVENTAKKYKTTKFDAIFASPLMRTMQTANIVNQYHNLKIIKDDRLLEVDQGIFTKRKRSSLTPKEAELKEKRDKKCKLESYEDVYSRVKDFLQDLASNCKAKNVLVVSHNLDVSFMECILLNIKVDINKDEHTTRFKNAEVKKFAI